LLEFYLLEFFQLTKLVFSRY